MGLEINTKAPDFTLPSTTGKDFKLSKDQAGKPCIIYFYPKDFTRGCTQEACEFRDAHEMFRDYDIDIYGVSRDTIASHNKFRKKHELPFHLLSDKSGKMIREWKAMLPIVGVPKRITYLLDKDHKIVVVFDNLFGADKHIKEMIAQVKG